VSARPTARRRRDGAMNPVERPDGEHGARHVRWQARLVRSVDLPRHPVRRAALSLALDCRRGCPASRHRAHRTCQRGSGGAIRGARGRGQASEVTGKSANVRPAAAGDDGRKRIVREFPELPTVNGDTHGSELERLSAARRVVGPRAVDALCRVSGGNLRDGAGERL